MTIFDVASDVGAATDVAGRPTSPAHNRRRAQRETWGRLPEAALGAAVGVLLVAAAYTAGRHGASWGVPVYWIGVILSFAAVAVRLLLRSALGAREPLGLVLIVATTSFLTKLLYSPLSFSFPDELQHWRSTYDVLTTHHLFTPNPALPISPHYPGLEIATAAVSSVTGLGIFGSGVTVTAVAHLLLSLALFCLFARLSGSRRIGALGVLLYATNAHFSSFDTMFLYQALGLTFMALTLLAAVAAVRSRAPRGWIAVAGIGLAATVVTHHVTSYLLVLALLLGTGVTAWRRRHTAGGRRALLLTGGLSIGGLALIIGWIEVAAPQTLSYLHGPVQKLFDSVRRLLIGMSATGPASNQVPPFADRTFTAAAALLVAILLPIVWLTLRRCWRSDHPRWVSTGSLIMLVASAGYFVVLAVRIGASDGQELAGRLMSYEFIPVAYVLAVFAVVTERRKVRHATRDLCALGAGGLLSVGSVTAGWPPWWERLPGQYLVAGFERSVDAEGIAAANWAAHALRPSQRFGADAGNAPVIGSYGRQDVVRNLSSLYTSPQVTAADITLVRQSAIRYLLVDRRMAEALPASGAYFPVDPHANRYRHPLALPALEKFDAAGASRLYDSGDIVVYDLRGSDYAP